MYINMLGKTSAHVNTDYHTCMSCICTGLLQMFGFFFTLRFYILNSGSSQSFSEDDNEKHCMIQL